MAKRSPSTRRGRRGGEAARGGRRRRGSADKHGKTAAVSALERGISPPWTPWSRKGRGWRSRPGEDLFVLRHRVGQARVGRSTPRARGRSRSRPRRRSGSSSTAADTERAKAPRPAGFGSECDPGPGVALATRYSQALGDSGALVDAGASVRPADPRPAGRASGTAPRSSSRGWRASTRRRSRSSRRRGSDLDAVARTAHGAHVDRVDGRSPCGPSGPTARWAPGSPPPDNVRARRRSRPGRRCEPEVPAVHAPHAGHRHTGGPREMAEMLLASVRASSSRRRSEADRSRADPVGSGETPITNDRGLFTGMKVGRSRGRCSSAGRHRRPPAGADRVVTRADRDLLYFAAAAGHWDLVKAALPHTKKSMQPTAPTGRP